MSVPSLVALVGVGDDARLELSDGTNLAAYVELAEGRAVLRLKDCVIVPREPTTQMLVALSGATESMLSSHPPLRAAAERRWAKIYEALSGGSPSVNYETTDPKYARVKT